MHAGAGESINGLPLLWGARIRGLVAGLGYAVSFASILVVSWTVQSQANHLPGLSAVEAVRRLAAALGRNALAILPAVPCLIVAINLAPRSALARLGWLAPPIVLMALWISQFWRADMGDTAWLATFFERLVAVTLLALVCLYHNSVRGAAEALLRERIENASLDAALDRSRLQLLRAQTEPHFLFNTLANVRTLARSDRTAATEMLGNLMLYLQAALPKMRQDSCPLAEEMQLIEAYLSIHRVRMGRRLSYEIAVPPELESVRVPTMMLLTLVENALKHGVDPIVGGGFIAVSASHERSKLVLTVADSGHGMSAQHSHGTGFGLANVRLRLMIQYGTAASFALSHAKPRGVVATISLPMPRTP